MIPPAQISSGRQESSAAFQLCRAGILRLFPAQRLHTGSPDLKILPDAYFHFPCRMFSLSAFLLNDLIAISLYGLQNNSAFSLLRRSRNKAVIHPFSDGSEAVRETGNPAVRVHNKPRQAAGAELLFSVFLCRIRFSGSVFASRRFCPISTCKS